MCCSSPCFLVLLCTHYGPLQCFATYFCKLKEIGVLRPIFPDYAISCDFGLNSKVSISSVFVKIYLIYKCYQMIYKWINFEGNFFFHYCACAKVCKFQFEHVLLQISQRHVILHPQISQNLDPISHLDHSV